VKKRCLAAPSAACAGLPRDIEVLRSLAWAGYLSTKQIEALHFPSRRVAQRRLRALLDHGLVRARLQGDVLLHRDNIYTLAAAGGRLLEERGAEEQVVQPRRVPQWRALQHALAIRDVFVAFRTAEREGLVVLDDVLFEGDLARAEDFRSAAVTPDSLVVLRTAGGERRIAIEVDLGTEPLRVIRHKLERYRDLYRVQTVHEIVFVLGGERRRLPDLAREAGLAAATRCVARPELTAAIRSCSSGPYAPPLRAVRIRSVAQTGAAAAIPASADAALGAHGFVHVGPARGGR